MKYLAVLIIPLISGCTTMGARESKVTGPDGKVYSVMCQSDGLMEYKDEKVQIKVDNRGRPGFLEQVFGTIVLGVTGANTDAMKAK